MELLEREQFFGQLGSIFNEVAAGNGHCVLVSGEAGIGKTSFVERFTEAHGKGAGVLWGACDALFTPRPLGPLYDIAHQIHGNLLTLLEEEAPRTSIFSAFLDHIEQGSSPSLTVIVDVHWADEATLDLLKFLGRRIHRVRSMLIVTYRDDQIGADHPLRLVLGDLPHRSVVRIRLPPLSEVAVDQLAERAGRNPEDLYVVTGGNPFFVTEALATKDPGVPVTVSDAVLSRAARLSPAARAALELVSVVPAKAENWLLNATINPATTTLEECFSAGMLRGDADVVAFRHELARRAIEDSLAEPRRRELHALVLKALLDRAPEALLARIVHHAAEAGDGAVVLEFAPLAAKQAAGLNAHRESASHYKTALKYTDTLAPDARARLLEGFSYECFLTGQTDEALNARAQAIQTWTELGNELRRGENLRWMSRITWFLGRRQEAEKYSAEAVAVLEALPPGPELAMAYSNRAQLHMLADEVEQAVFWGTRAIELSKELGATEALVHALNNVGTAQLIAHDEQGRIKLEESLQLSLAHGFQEHVARAYTNLGSAALRFRDYRLAIRYLDSCIDYTSQHDLDFPMFYMMAWRARALFEQGDWDQAADDAISVLNKFQGMTTVTKLAAMAVLGHIRVRSGDPDADRLLNEARDIAIQTGELQRVAPVASARAELAWLQGNLDQLRDEARSVLGMANVHDEPWITEEFAFWMWRAGAEPELATNVTPYAHQIKGDWRTAAAAWKTKGCQYEEAMALAEGDEPAQRTALEIL